MIYILSTSAAFTACIPSLSWEDWVHDGYANHTKHRIKNPHTKMFLNMGRLDTRKETITVYTGNKASWCGIEANIAASQQWTRS